MWWFIFLLLFSGRINGSLKPWYDYIYLKNNFMGKTISEVTNQGFRTYITNVYSEEGDEIYKIKLFLTTNDYIILWSYPVSDEQTIVEIDVYTPKVYIYGDIHIGSDLKDLLKKEVNFVIYTNKKNNLIQRVIDTNNGISFHFDNKKSKNKIDLIILYGK